MRYNKWSICLVLFCCTQLCAATRSRNQIPTDNTPPVSVTADTPFALNPPKGWQCISEKDQLPGMVQLLYVGSGKTGQLTPSINLATEETTLSQEEYIQLAKQYHETQGDTTCTSLGPVETKAGKACIIQIDRKTTWGDVRFIQASLVNQNVAYVITATCLQKDFTTYCASFFQSIQSFTIFNSSANVK